MDGIYARSAPPELSTCLVTGRRTAHASFSRPGPTATGYTFNQYVDIYTIRPDGADLRRLTTDRISGAASWTVGGRIGFLRMRAVTAPQRQFWLMDADGGNATQFSVVSPLLQTAWPISWPP